MIHSILTAQVRGTDGRGLGAQRHALGQDLKAVVRLHAVYLLLCNFYNIQI